MPFGLQPGHLILIFLIVVLIFGPERLTNYARSLVKNLLELMKKPREMHGGLPDKINRKEESERVASPAGTQIVCVYCGTTNPPLSRYCSKCGISLSR
jgi:Sec-independent protein translocase protein TatA